MSWPEFQPAIPEHSYHVGADGRLWLRRGDVGGETIPWLVLDPDGFPTGVLDLPRSDFRIAWTREDLLWAIELDAFDVPWLVRYRIQSQDPLPESR
jgi:hypothetical protein